MKKAATMIRTGLGPVFTAESRAVTRRWQLYAGRSLLVGAVLIGLLIAWPYAPADRSITTIQLNATAASRFVATFLAVELVLALVLAPAAAAGAVCQDKTRGVLTQMLLTDLSDAEIVLEKFGSQIA